MRRAHEDDSRSASSKMAETTLVWLQRDEEGLFHDQSAETVCNKKNGTLSLVQAAIGYGISQGLSMSTEAFSTGVPPEAYHVGVVAVGDNSRSRILGT